MNFNFEDRAKEARNQLKMISELPDGWGYDYEEEGNPAYKKEFVKYCSNILETIIDTFGENNVPFITPIWNGTAIQMEYEEIPLGYLEFEIHEDKHVGVFYLKQEDVDRPYSNITPTAYNELEYYNNIEKIILECIEKYLNNNLYNNFPILVPPKETIKDLMEDRTISKSELAIRMYMTEPEIEDLLTGRLSINANIAARLQKAFGVPPSFWLNLQNNYDREVLGYGVLRSTETSNKQMDEE